jgi:CO/xanthine dehydrogenase FAD-binding subunit
VSTASTTTRSYVEAADVASAVAALAAGARPVAGGTDLVVGARHGKAPLPESLVGIHRIGELASVVPLAEGGLRIGALVTHASIAGHADVLAAYAGLADASAIVGSHATRANGTLGGNVMNASPAMDTGAPLLCHDAVAVLVGPSGERRVPLSELWTGPGRTSAGSDELLVAVELAPTSGARSGSGYVRLQYRRQMEIAVVGVGASVEIGDDGLVSAARVAISALSPVIERVPAAEAALLGTDGASAIEAAAQAVAAASRPISDVRGSADYRRAMAAVMARRAVLTAVRRAHGETIAVPASDTTFGA